MVLVYYFFSKGVPFSFRYRHFQCGTLFCSQDSSVGIVTRSLAGRSGIQMVEGGRAFSLLQNFQPALVEEMRHAEIRTDRQTDRQYSTHAFLSRITP